MKKTVKIISAICAIVMLLGILPIMSASAADTATLVITPSREEVKAGREFTLTFTIENNTGLGGIAFDMPIDTNAFEFVDATYEGMIFVNLGICDFDDNVNAYKFNATGNGRANITEDGFLAKVILRAKEDAVISDYTFATEIDQKNTIVITGEEPNYSSALATIATPSTSVGVIPDVAVSTITSASVLLGTDISVKYYAMVDNDHAGAQMKFTMNDIETVVEGTATGVVKGYTEEYEYTFTGIAPQHMGDNIKAELIFDGDVVATKDEYSVLENCNNLLNESAADLGLDADQYSAMKTLIADLLVYGAKAQLYCNYKTDALVDAAVTGATPLGEISADEDFKDSDESEEAIAFTAVGVYFDYANSIYFKFTAPDVTDANFKVVITKYDTDYNELDAVEYTISECELIDEATSTYKIHTEDVSVLEYGDAIYTAELQVKSGKKFVAVQYVDYTVNSYAYAKQDSADADMANLAKALYNYGVSAAAFQDSFNG